MRHNMTILYKQEFVARNTAKSYMHFHSVYSGPQYGKILYTLSFHLLWLATRQNRILHSFHRLWPATRQNLIYTFIPSIVASNTAKSYIQFHSIDSFVRIRLLSLAPAVILFSRGPLYLYNENIL